MLGQNAGGINPPAGKANALRAKDVAEESSHILTVPSLARRASDLFAGGFIPPAQGASNKAEGRGKSRFYSGSTPVSSPSRAMSAAVSTSESPSGNEMRDCGPV